jgi:hypothetical protein
MFEPQRFIRLDAESDEFEEVHVVAIAPRRRDIWAILRGRYVPLVRRRRTSTVAGLARAAKQAFTREALGLDEPNPLLEALRRQGRSGRATVPIVKREDQDQS